LHGVLLRCWSCASTIR